MATNSLLALPSVQVFAACCIVLVLKMAFLAFYVGILRKRAKRYLNPEDAESFGGEAGDSEAVERVRRAHYNDIENLVPFFIVGLLYVLGGATPRGATIYCVTFTVSRILHGWFYLGSVQPWRTLAFVVGLLCILGMATQVALRILGVG
jgi:uncharacterized MAPEG superfamily protein